MAALSRLLGSTALAATLALAGLAPAPARAQSGDDLVRVIVDVADMVMRGNQPYYRYGDYGANDRLVVGRDRYGRPVYYRNVPRGYAYGYDARPDVRRAKCNKHGKCKVEYYDPRYDRRGADRYYGYYDRRDRYGRYQPYDRYDRDDRRYRRHGD